jgi:hypothetical protein
MLGFLIDDGIVFLIDHQQSFCELIERARVKIHIRALRRGRQLFNL